MVVASLSVAILGGLVERLLLRYMYKREELYQLLFTYALVLIFSDACKFIWGTQPHSVSRPPILAGSFDFYGVRFPHYDLFIILLGPLIALGFWVLLNRTSYGRIIRAAALDREMLGALGTNVPRSTPACSCWRPFLAGLVGRARLADQERGARHGRRDHHRGLHRRRHRRPGLAVGYAAGLPDLRPDARVRHPDLPALLHLCRLRDHGRGADRAAVGPAGEAA